VSRSAAGRLALESLLPPSSWQPSTERLSERPARRSPRPCCDQGRVQGALRLPALQASKRTGIGQRRLHSTATCQTARASVGACFPPSPTRHRRSSLPFAALRSQATWIEAHRLSLVQGVLVTSSPAWGGFNRSRKCRSVPPGQAWRGPAWGRQTAANSQVLPLLRLTHFSAFVANHCLLRSGCK